MTQKELLSKIRALELWHKKLLERLEIGTFKGLSEIHHYLFQDVFEFAGKIRNLNISKGNFKFAPVLFLESNLKIIDKMPHGTFHEIIKKYVEMNIAHPFLDGNGRASRIWLDCMLRQGINLCVDWSLLDKQSYLKAMEKSVINSKEIESLLGKALTEKIDCRVVYLNGIHASFYFEGFGEFSVEEIDKRK